MKLTKEIILKAGGNLWEKGSISRVYLNQQSFDNLFSEHFSEYSAYADSKIGKAKIWFDCGSETLHADVGMIRVMFNATGITCKK